MYNVLRNVTNAMDTRHKGRLWGVERRTTLKARGLRWFGSNEIMGKKGSYGNNRDGAKKMQKNEDKNGAKKMQKDTKQRCIYLDYRRIPTNERRSHLM